MSSCTERLKNGIITENPTFVMMLGMCPTLAVTSSAINGLGMGLTTTAVLILSNAFISLLRKVIPDKVRIPAFIVIVASFVTIIQLLLQGYMQSLNKALGVYIPLIVVNCIILGRAEAYASKNPVLPSIFDGLGMGLGFTFGLTCIGICREILGSGAIFNHQFIPEDYHITFFVLAPGAFLVLSFLTALQNKLKMPSATNVETNDTNIACGGNCASCIGSSCAANKGLVEAERVAAKAAKAQAAKEAAETAANAAGTADVADKKVGISIYKFDDNFMTLYRQELQRYLTEDLGFKPENVVIQDGKGDQAEQTNQINNFITQKYDVLILNLVQASSAPEITDMCKEAGIPVVYINREPDEAEEQRWVDEKINATYVGCDARQSGTYQGEEILETETKGDINGDGKVSYIMIQGDPENVDAQYRTEFSVKALTDAGVEVEELLKQRGDWDQAKAQQIAQDALNQYGDKIEVIFCNNDAMALGALQAIEAAGRKVNEDIYLVGVDALTEAVQNVIDGKQTGTVFNDHFSQAKAAADAAVQFISGEEVDAKIPVDYIKVTNANAQEILDKLK